MTHDALFAKLARSAFRARFHLRAPERQYCDAKGRAVIARHAQDFVAQRLAPATPKNDGRQTPMRGHPVFVAQHATACCCRECLRKWHAIPQGVELSVQDQRRIVSVLIAWIDREMGFVPPVTEASNAVAAMNSRVSPDRNT